MADIAAVASDLKTAQSQQQYAVQVLSKIQDVQKMEGQAAIKLIESAPKPQPTGPIGQNVDTFA
jgi:hypothetical protein